jgi:integrase
MDYRKIASFVAELRQQEGVPARALEFAILTAARTAAVTGATWDQVDINAKIWTIARERMMTGRERCVPLSDAAVTILKKMAVIRQGDFVFPGSKTGRPLGNLAFPKLLKRMGQGDMIAHGFRPSFRDWADNASPFPSGIAKLALGYTLDDKETQLCMGRDLLHEHRELMEAWVEFCGTPALATAE